MLVYFLKFSASSYSNDTQFAIKLRIVQENGSLCKLVINNIIVFVSRQNSNMNTRNLNATFYYRCYSCFENRIQRPQIASLEEMTKYHSDDYILFLKVQIIHTLSMVVKYFQNIRPDNIPEFGRQMQRFNVGEDCPGNWLF